MSLAARAFDIVKQSTADFRRRAEKAQQAYADLKAGSTRIREQVMQEAERLGLGAPEQQGPVIDVGDQTPSALARSLRAVGALVVVGLLTSGFVAFGAFFVQFLLALFIANRVLKIRIDLIVPQGR